MNEVESNSPPYKDVLFRKYTVCPRSGHLAFFRHKLGTRLGSKYKPLRSRDQQIQQAQIINLFKMGFEEKREGLG